MPFVLFTAQPVHDELEYIKMRYRSPARRSFHHNNKKYDTLNTTTTSTTTMYSTTLGQTNIDEENAEQLQHRQKHPSSSSSQRQGYPSGGFEPDLPWSPKVEGQGSTDYGFNSSAKQPLFRPPPGQTII